jgi:predicted GNAT superfamily acetyltransferase
MEQVTNVTIERVQTIAECQECLRIGAEVWGDGVACSVPQMLVHAKYGGVVLLARSEGRAIGFLFSFPALYQGETVLWSHETAVLPEWQHHGVGFYLKQTQRDIARELGYRAIAWTYDPLVARNAHFNLNKLGARVREFVVNAYGTDPSDRVNRGMETDRFIAVWPTVEDTSPDSPLPVSPRETWLSVDSAGYPRFGFTGDRGDKLTIDEPTMVLTEIPKEFLALLETAWDQANAWRSAFRHAATTLFDSGYAPKHFRVEADRACYVWVKRTRE